MNQEYAYGMWIIMAFNVGLFLFFFVSFLVPKEKLEWRNMGIITAFLVALFSEMYGFPLTIYLLTGWLGDAYPVLQPFNHKFGHLWVVVLGGSNLAWFFVMGLSLASMLAGYTLLSKGWKQVHDGNGDLITDGVYGYARHPQYTGLILVIIGFLIQWPTLLTVLMAPLLIGAYVHLSRYEEKVMTEKFGQRYQNYIENLPLFSPTISKWKDFIFVPVDKGEEQSDSIR